MYINVNGGPGRMWWKISKHIRRTGSRWFRVSYSNDEILEGNVNRDGSLILTLKIHSGEDWEMVSSKLPPESVQKLIEWLNQTYKSPDPGKILVLPNSN